MTGALYLLAGVAVVALVAWSVRYEARAKAKRVNQAFAGREALAPDMFFARYFRDRGVAPEVVFAIRRILEAELDADLSRLRADDDFSANLGFFWDYDSMADVAIICAIEAHFHIRITDAEAEKARTISDLVDLVAEKIRPRAGV